MPAHLVQDRSQIIGTHMFHQRYGNRATTKETGLGGDPANDDEHLNPEETKIFNNAQTVKVCPSKNDEKSMYRKIQTLHSLV